MTATLTYTCESPEMRGVIELGADATHVGRWTPEGDDVQVVKQPLAGPNCILVTREGILYAGFPSERMMSRQQFKISRVTGPSSIPLGYPTGASEAGDAFTIEDLGSSGGTCVNEKRISGPTALLDGDRIHCRVGFQFHLHVETPGAPGEMT